MGLWKVALTRKGHYAALNKEDYLELHKYTWHLSEDGYSVRKLGKNSDQRMHRDVMGLMKDDDLVVDHLDGDRLNNTRSNLRAVTQKENSQNVPSRSGTSKYKGIRLQDNGKWEAYAYDDGKNIHIGTYEEEWKAAMAAKNYRRKHYDGYNEDRDFDSAYFYILIDPRDGGIRYLGKSVDPEDRLTHHCKPSARQSSDTWKNQWLNELYEETGEGPCLFMLEEVPEEFWEEREEMWIDALRASGEPLTNEQLGGQGQTSGVVRRNTTRRKLRAARLGKSQGGSSKFVGVSFNKSKGVWSGFYSYYGQNHYVGSFDTEKECAKAVHECRCEEYGPDEYEDHGKTFDELWTEVYPDRA